MTIESSSVGKSGWNLGSGDSTRVRKYFAGKWSDPVHVQEAQLDLLDKIEGHLRVIRFRVGFLALVLLVSIVVPILLFLSVVGSLSEL